MGALSFRDGLDLINHRFPLSDPINSVLALNANNNPRRHYFLLYKLEFFPFLFYFFSSMNNSHLFFIAASRCNFFHLICSDLRPRNSRRGRQHLGRRIIFYSIYAWGVPFVIVLVGQILDHVNVASHVVKPNFGVVKCWFSGTLS